MKYVSDYSQAHTGVFADIKPIKDRIMENAIMAFERNKVPGVAYSHPKLVERNNSYFIEWTPVGFEVAL